MSALIQVKDKSIIQHPRLWDIYNKRGFLTGVIKRDDIGRELYQVQFPSIERKFYLYDYEFESVKHE